MTDLTKENNNLRHENDNLRKENSCLLELVEKLARQMEESIEYCHDHYLAIMMWQYREEEQDRAWGKMHRK